MRYLKRSHHDAVCPPFLTLFDEIRDRSMKGKKKKRNGSAFVEDILTISHPISYDPRDTTLSVGNQPRATGILSCGFLARTVHSAGPRPTKK